MDDPVQNSGLGGRGGFGTRGKREDFGHDLAARRFAGSMRLLTA